MVFDYSDYLVNKQYKKQRALKQFPSGTLPVWPTPIISGIQITDSSEITPPLLKLCRHFMTQLTCCKFWRS